MLSKNTKIKLHWAVILSVDFYGCETWSLTLRADHWLLVFKNGMLRKILATKMEKVLMTGKKLHNEELHDLYSSPNIIWMIK
jgi:hypothetical protein